MKRRIAALAAALSFVVVENGKELFVAPLPPPSGTASGVFKRQ